MRTVILAGGRGTRLTEETATRPKPMVEIGGRPILWHLMQFFASFGHKDFLVACGYRGELIKEYFASYFLHHSDCTIHLKDGTRDVLSAGAPARRAGESTFNATGRSCFRSRARYTVAMPPRPASRSSS